MTSNADAVCPECGATEPDWNGARADPDSLRAEIERLQELLRGTGANRYWEGRWRDAQADLTKLRAALKPFADMATVALRTPGDCAFGTMTVEINYLLFAKGAYEQKEDRK